MAPRLVVELDDSSHQTKKGRERDELVDSVLGATELPILHVPWNQNYDCDQLGQQIRDLTGSASGGGTGVVGEFAMPASKPAAKTRANTKAAVPPPLRKVEPEEPSAAPLCPNCLDSMVFA